ncbi:hypothetical protein [Aestuariivirga sp.]|uniref:hypothetical protein n=1 Tax=Aestuariivirga sp. TaxID=2650926 RepID=UPI0035941C83
MLRRLATSLIGASVVTIVAMGFACAFCSWWNLDNATANTIYLMYAGALAVTIFLFLVGQFIGISSHAYFLIVGGAVFLGLDFLVWQNFGLMPSVKFLRNGFAPSAIMGLLAGVAYRVIAIPAAMPRRDG